MSAKEETVIAFDLYGTLLSTESIAKELAKHFEENKAANIAALWRRYQLEYTWRLNSARQFESFSSITWNSLVHALSDSDCSLNSSSIISLMAAYDSLSTFPDVSPALEALAQKSNITAVVFSNGTHSMVANSVQSSPNLVPHARVFKDIITVEDVARFKPAPEVYHHLARKVGKPLTKEGMAGIWLVSGNAFDVVGARAVGMKAVWVDRESKGWTDQLIQGEAGKPTFIVRELGEVVDGIERYLQSHA